AARGQINMGRMATAMPYHDAPADIASGDGTAMVRDFLAWAQRNGIRVGGGLPAGFADSPMPAATRAAIRAVFIEAGARFIDLGDRYPRSAFFDTPDHLNEVAQIARSRAVAAALSATLAPGRAAS